MKRFINEHLPSYPDVEIKYIGGADPEMVLLSEDSTEVKRVPVSKLSEEEIMELLSSHGIVKRAEENEDIHEDL